MKTSRKILSAIIYIACLLTGVSAEYAEAGFLMHATMKAFVPKITKSGFKTASMNPKARFGKQIYFADKAKTALKERPNADALMRFRKSRLFNERTLDTTHMSNNRLRAISGMKDMRGTVKNGVLGPKIGNRIGRFADSNKLIVKYNSARYKPGKDYALSPSLYKQHSRIVRAVSPLNVN